MTDKQLIKEEIERLKNEQLSIFSKGESVEICGTALDYIGIYNQLLSFIDSLPEEPKFKVGDKVRKDNGYLTYLIDNIKDGFYKLVAIGEDGNRGCTSYFNVKYQTELKVVEEPVSEELEEEYKRFTKSSDNGVSALDIARHFVEWQKEKHDKQFGFLKLKDCKNAYNEWKSTQDNPSAALAWIRACEWQKQQMMKNAVEGEVVYKIGSSIIAPTDIRYKVMSDRVYISNVKLGDKVKIIIVKEEQQ